MRRWPTPPRRLRRQRRASAPFPESATHPLREGTAMSLISFIKEAGEKLFKHPQAEAPAGAPAAAQPDIAQLNATAGAAIEKYIASQGLQAEGLNVGYDGATQTVTVSGVAADQATKEKIVLCCGNVASVAKVNDMLTVAAAGRARVEVPHGQVGRHLVEDRQGRLRRRQRLHEDLRGEQADAQGSEQDLSGTDAAHSRLRYCHGRDRQGRRQVDARHAGAVVGSSSRTRPRPGSTTTRRAWARRCRTTRVFSMAPLLLIVISIAGLVFGEEAARGEIFGQLRRLMGADARQGDRRACWQACSKPAEGVAATRHRRGPAADRRDHRVRRTAGRARPHLARAGARAHRRTVGPAAHAPAVVRHDPRHRASC